MSKNIVLFSTKGGVGKTLLSVNIALSLAKQKKRVLLIDADFGAVGDMARMLNAKTKRSLADIMHALKKKENIKLEDFIVSQDENVGFIPAILRPQQSHHFDPRLIKNIIAIARGSYDYIIVDGGKAFNENLIGFLDEGNLLLLVVTPDILSVYQTKWALDALQSLNFPLKMVKIVLNRAESLSSISWREIKLVFPCELIARIPSEGKVAMLSINKREPVIKSFPTNKISKAINNFALDLIARNDLYLGHKQLQLIKDRGKTKKDLWEKMGLTEMLGKQLEKEQLEHDDLIALKQRIHHRLIESLDLKRLEVTTFTDEEKVKELQTRTERLIGEFLAQETSSLLGSMETRKKLIEEIRDEALGLGPLEEFLKDPEVTEVMVNNKDEVYIERKGKIELTSKRFISNEQVKTIIDRIIAPIGRHIDESIPMVDARLPDGSRVNAIIPPLSLTGPSVTIRKFRKQVFSPDELIGFNSLTNPMKEFLRGCVIARKNMIVSGGTGSGKTTVLNVLSSFIPGNERIITIEDAAELKLGQTHWIRLESRPPNIEGKGAITIRDLFRNTLRMRPDRIIIGECRGSETLDMLQAMNTGHDGSMTTLHANSTHDVLSRLDSLILMSGVELPLRAIREMVASAIDVIVHTARLSDGTRKVIQITELAGLLPSSDDINLKDIFQFNQTGIDSEGNVEGYFAPTGYIPTFFEDMKHRGVSIKKDIFQA